MGIFDKFMHAIGFASDEELEAMDTKHKKTKTPPKKSNTIQNEYVLKTASNPNIVDFTPSSQDEIIQIIELMKKGASVRIKLSHFDNDSLYRAVDFLQGACLVLEIQPKFLKGETIELVQ